MINGIQVKMARTALGWGVRDLAEKSGINPGTVSRLETGGGIQSSNLEKIEETLVKGGVLFIPADEQGGVGVRLRERPAK